MTTEEARANLRESLKSSLEKMRPPERLTVDGWADKFRRVRGGRWRTSRVEVARGPLQALTEPGVRIVTCMMSTQLMKTEVILNAIGRFAQLDPCPMLLVQPKDDTAQKFSKNRLAKMIRESPALKVVFGRSKGRDSSNTIMLKEFDGGRIMMVGANSPVNLASEPIRITLFDEVDKYPASAGAEGDVIALGEERLETYPTNSLSVRVSSPTIKGESRIETSYLESDQRKPHATCPHCDHVQLMEWERVSWTKNEDGVHQPETAAYYCSGCGVGWTEADRQAALKPGKIHWLQTATFYCCNHKHEPSTWDPNDHATRWDGSRAKCSECGKTHDHPHAGFWANKLYSPWRPLSEMVRKWLTAQSSPELLQVFINTQLAETFEDRGEVLESGTLLDRREAWSPIVPAGVGLLTAGVDVGQDRIECEIVGWGFDEESWSVGYLIFHGDPHQREVWDQLDAALLQPWESPQGQLYVAAACVDMGYATAAVEDYCAPRIGRRIWPIKGVETPESRKPVWPRKPKRSKTKRVEYYQVGVNAAKDLLHARLRVKQPGPGYCHFPLDRDVEWFEQLTAEKRVTKRKNNGASYKAWILPKGKRAEAMDCRNYAFAALRGLMSLNMNLNKVVMTVTGQTWQAPQVEAPEVPKPTPAEQPAAQTQPKPVPPSPAKPARKKMRVVKSKRLRR
ncbi:MAG: phage terminase large subunit family protein [Alphaproteobacteria bacterium]